MKQLIITGIIFAIVCIAVIVDRIEFYQNCSGHLELAASANTIDIAISELQIAIEYAEEKNLTSGYTSVLWKTPDEDVGFWFNNIKSAKEELTTLPAESTSLEKSNMLMKLRETLLNNSGEQGDTLVVPNGLLRYPYNGIWGATISITTIMLILSLIMWLKDGTY